MLQSDPLFDLSTIEIELIVGITVGVACIFSLVGGWLNKTVGRRLTIIVSSILFAIGSIVMGAAKECFEFYFLIFFKFF